MKLSTISPAKSLSKAYLKQSLRREQVDLFKKYLTRLLEKINEKESEEHLKNLVSEFLKDTWYKQTNEINTSGRADLVIHNGMTSSSSVGVLIEVKRPGNKSEMISPDRPNIKALHELLLYYLRERYLNDNREIKHLIVCNVYEWYIFDGADFEQLFFSDKKLGKEFKEWEAGLFGLDKTEWFYENIAKRHIESQLQEITCVHFNLKDFEQIIRKPAKVEDNKLINLYKVLSPTHLLKQSFANDANSLNREFYNELLHILGLEEIKDKGKKLISRKAPEKRNDESLLENTITMLSVLRTVDQLDNPEQFGSSEDERLFSIGLELCIIWLNRILFLKLLEGQLIAYHRGDRAYAFLKNDIIKDFDDLQELFFEVLARRQDDRSSGVALKFASVPYLNSSLFEISDLERKTLQVSNLKGRLEMPVYSATVLKDASGKRICGAKNTLGYLFSFLDAYDFASEYKADIQETAKTIINASVLGLIFEKINGYRDGSFYTPGFITMYMSREAIRRSVVQKFRDANQSGCQNPADFSDLGDKLDYTDKEMRRRANDIINSLRICDPAVGSGHFLVSALNEIIAIKSDLHILTDREGKRLHGCVVTIENDELIVTVEDELFVYNPKDPESRRIQEALFHEKQTIIENCLFGVDINPKSVSICRLRLWIELLKNAYYTRESDYSELETLPNIDINIKCGNSLVSRFALRNGGSQHLSQVELNRRQQLTKRYKEKVWQYKLGPANKTILRKEIALLKEDLQTFGVPADKDLLALRKLKNELDQKGFGFVREEMEQYHALIAKEEELKRVVAEKLRTVYGNAFEWRFEFPEVLDENGEFVGFDVIIGNPPFGVLLQKELKPLYQTFTQRGESYVLFVEKGHELLREGGQFSYIMPDTYLNLSFTESLRDFILKNSLVLEIVTLPAKVFDEAVVDTTLLFTAKSFPTPTFHNGQVKIKSFAKQGTNIDLDAPYRSDTVLISQWHGLGTFNLLGDVNSSALLYRFDQTFRKIEAFTEMFYGIKTYQVGKGKPPQTEEIRNGKPFTASIRLHEGFLPFYDGKHVGRYSLLWQENNWLHYGPWLAEPRNPNKFIGEKILIRKIIGKTLIATYVPETSYCNTLLYVLKLKPETSLSYLYLLGILNSRLIGWYFRSKFQISAEDTFPQIMISDIQQFPIPEVSDLQQNPIIERVQKILEAKKSPPAPLSEGGSETTDIVTLETEIDQLVYALYGLTEEEIELVEGKR
jgi:hypothetical protein